MTGCPPWPSAPTARRSSPAGTTARRDSGTPPAGDASPAPPLIHSGRQVFGVAFSPDGKTIITGGQDWMARLWDVATMRPIGPPIEHDDWVRAVAFGPDGRTFVTPNGFHPTWPRDAERLPDDPPRVQAWLRTITGL